jgi:type IV pilus assembly protein PilY1
MITRLIQIVTSILLVTASPMAWPVFDPVNDDTDIFLANPAYSSARPNVLIFVDNSANWSSTSSGTTKYAAVKAALTASLTNIVTDAYNVGLGLFVETGNPNSNVDGAYIRYGVRQMTGRPTDVTSNKGALLSVIDNLNENRDKGNGAKYSISFSEIFKYFAGLTSRSGHGKEKADAGGSVYLSTGRQTLAGSPLPASALPTTRLASAYNSPIVDGCQKNFVIFISNGEANDATADISTAETLYTTDIGQKPVTIPLTPSGSSGILADEYAKYMASGDCNRNIDGTQNVFTYTIDILPRTVGQGPAHTALLKSMAANGKGKYFAVNSIRSTAEIEAILEDIFKEVQAVNSVFASTTLPVSVNVRGTNLNQVYIGVFRPDENKNPRWFGNLKLYKLGENTATNTLFLADANGNVAENASTGFISNSAQSFWTTTQTPNFWTFNPQGNGGASDLPDGDLVEKGGAAQQLRIAYAASQATRNVFTCVNGSGGLCSNNSLLSATPFNNSNVSATDLGVATTTDRDNLIDWSRGADNKVNENNGDATVTTDIRASIHGDVLHSRPAIINYNRYGDDNDIYAFYGSNDGLFRAVKGGISRHTTGPDAALIPGSERWSFIPKEFFPKLNRLREQSPTISRATPKDYFFDGSIGVYQKDANNDGIVRSADGDKVYLYASLRRGGNFIYALDVTDPAAPRLLWRKGFGDTGWEQVGQTWSEPKVARVSASLGNSSNPDNIVLIFGAGYDPEVEDINPCLVHQMSRTNTVVKAIGTGTVTYTDAGSCTITDPTGSTTTVSRTKGRAILVVDAFNGNVIWQAGGGLTTSAAAGAKKLNVPRMTCAISSDISVIDINRDGLADRLYVGDTCGQMWRVNLFGTDMDEWSVTRIARISSIDVNDIPNKRKFMFPPDLVFGTDSSGTYTAVLVGSGDREHAFDTNITNEYYMFKDRDDSTEVLRGKANSTSVKISGYATTPTGSFYTTDTLFNATSAVVDNSNSLSLNGWRLTLLAGEKVISSATTVGGSTFFNTNQPSATAAAGICTSNLGVAREYIVGFADAAPTQDLNALGNLSLANRSSVRAGGGFLPSPVPVVVDIGGHKHEAVISGTSVRQPPSLTLDKRIRVYWYKNVD